MGGTLSLVTLLRRPEAGTVLGLIVVYAVFSILGGANFMGTTGLSSWLNICAEVGIIALPVGLLMIAGFLDISVGSIVPASSLTVGIIANYYEMPIVLAIAVPLDTFVSSPSRSRPEVGDCGLEEEDEDATRNSQYN